MPIEPSEADRQALAFDHLREQARRAHLEGDGLLVNNLCALALSQFAALAEKGSLQLGLERIKWACVFPIYWLIDDFMLRSVERVLTLAAKATHPPRPLLEALHSYHYFVKQPLGDISSQVAILNSLKFTELGRFDEPELKTLLTHMIELLWFRSTSEGNWLRVVDGWRQRVSPELRSLLEALRLRLLLQTRLTCPNAAFPVVSPTDLEVIPKDLALSRLWLFTLRQDGEELDRELEKLNATISPDSHIARLLFDFHHWNRFFGGWGDPQEVGLTRRWLLTSSSPLLTFTEMREARLSEKLGHIFRRGGIGEATERFECLSLSMLCEVAALRAWDWSAWVDAIRSQSEAYLEVSRWESMQGHFPAHAVRLAVQGLNYRTKQKDALTRNAICLLEFAPQQMLTELTEALLAAYPCQKQHAWGAFQDLSDLVPVKLWPRLAEWTLEYAQEIRERRRMGGPGLPLSFWAEILPFTEESSGLWGVLLAEALREATNPIVWYSDGPRLLVVWLRHAPIELARQVGTELLKARLDGRLINVRCNLLEDAQAVRPELQFSAGKPVPPGKQVPRTSEEASNPPSNSHGSEKAVYRQRLIDFMAEAVSARPGAPFQFAFISNEPISRLPWDEADLPLVEQIIATVENPKALSDHLVSLLCCLGTLILEGPESYAQFVLPHFVRWAASCPKGTDPTERMKGPFSTLQFTGSFAADIHDAFGWVGFQLFQKLRASVVQDIATWLQRSVLSPEPKAVPIMVYTSIPAAVVAAPATRAELLGACHMLLLHLWSRQAQDHECGDALANALARLGMLLQAPTSFLADWHSGGGRETLAMFIPKFSPLLCACGSSAHPDVRSAVAKMLTSMQGWTELPDSLRAALSKLSLDNRARVRHACKPAQPKEPKTADVPSDSERRAGPPETS